MVNRPKQIGTAAETAVVRYLRQWWPDAKREPLRGNRDEGDIRTGNIVWEVKGGNTARGTSSAGSAGPALLSDWMRQTELERQNAGARFGILVTARRGYGASRCGSWWAYLPADHFANIFHAYPSESPYPVRLELQHLIQILRDQGWAPYAA